MLSENEKVSSVPNASAVLNSTIKTFSQPNASYGRSKVIAKHKRNEKQQLIYHMEEIVDVQAS